MTKKYKNAEERLLLLLSVLFNLKPPTLHRFSRFSDGEKIILVRAIVSINMLDVISFDK